MAVPLGPPWLYVISISEDGDVSFRAESEEDILRRIEESGPPCEGHIPKMDGSEHKGHGACWVIIRGHLVFAKPVAFKWDLIFAPGSRL